MTNSDALFNTARSENQPPHHYRDQDAYEQYRAAGYSDEDAWAAAEADFDATNEHANALFAAHAAANPNRISEIPADEDYSSDWLAPI